MESQSETEVDHLLLCQSKWFLHTLISLHFLCKAVLWNWREPSALKLKNLGYPAYDLYEKTKVFRSAESKSLATDHQALLEHSPAVILVRRICSMTVKTLFTCQPFKFTFLLNRHLATNYFGLSVGRLFHRSSCQLWKILCSMATKMVTTSRFACWSFSYFVTFIFDWTHRQ